MIEHIINLTAGNETIIPDLTAVQNDSGRSLRMRIIDMTLEAGMSGTLSFKRSDQTFYELAATLDVSTNSFLVDDIAQALTQDGKTEAQLKIFSNNKKLSTYVFNIRVRKDVSGTVTPQEGESITQAVEDALAATGAFIEEQVTGTTPTITAEINHRYICGEVTSLSFTPPTDGIVAVVFESGATPTILTLPSTVLMPEWYEVEANTINEINISDGIYGAVMVWPR